MKKHPAIKFILILVVSGAFGAVLSMVTMGNISTLESAVNAANAFMTQYNHILHIGVCLVLSLIQLSIIIGAKRLLAEPNLENNDDALARLDKKSNAAMMVGTLELISNFFLFSACIVYAEKDNILISTFTVLVFLSFNAWAEVAQINMAKKLESRFNNIDPMSFKFHKDWEKTSDEAEKYAMYRAGFRSYRASSLTILLLFTACLLIQMSHHIGIMPFIVIAVLWAVQNISYIKAISKTDKK